jgi:hypothetical protein
MMKKLSVLPAFEDVILPALIVVVLFKLMLILQQLLKFTFC